MVSDELERATTEFNMKGTNFNPQYNSSANKTKFHTHFLHSKLNVERSVCSSLKYVQQYYTENNIIHAFRIQLHIYGNLIIQSYGMITKES